MFETLFAVIVRSSTNRTRRAEGAAFLKVARDLYQLGSVAYLCLNIPIATRAGHYAHCTYSDREVTHCIGMGPVGVDQLDELGLSSSPADWEVGEWATRLDYSDRSRHPEQRALTFPLAASEGENAASMKQWTSRDLSACLAISSPARSGSSRAT